jgi:hypothetical protein
MKYWIPIVAADMIVAVDMIVAAAAAAAAVVVVVVVHSVQVGI